MIVRQKQVWYGEPDRKNPGRKMVRSPARQEEARHTRGQVKATSYIATYRLIKKRGRRGLI